MQTSAHPSACILGKKPRAMHAEEKPARLPSIEVEYCNGYWDRMRPMGCSILFNLGFQLSILIRVLSAQWK